MTHPQWSPAVVLVDADYADAVAFDLIVNFERILGRRVPQADLSHWLDCIALDGGLRPGDNAVQAVFLHSAENESLKNFVPGRYADELDGKAFKDNLGEFTLHAFPVEEVVSKADFYIESLSVLLASPEVKQLMVVADMGAYGEAVKRACASARDKDITLFAMEPLAGRGFSQELLGYSLMSALGIKGEELG